MPVGRGHPGRDGVGHVARIGAQVLQRDLEQGRRPAADEVWYQAITSDHKGDDTVPTFSSIDPFLNDPVTTEPRSDLRAGRRRQRSVVGEEVGRVVRQQAVQVQVRDERRVVCCGKKRFSFDALREMLGATSR